MALTRLMSVTTIKQDGHPAMKSNCQMDSCGSHREENTKDVPPQFADSVTLQLVLGDNRIMQYLFIDQ